MTDDAVVEDPASIRPRKVRNGTDIGLATRRVGYLIADIQLGASKVVT